jgi:serine protease Do
MKDYCDILRGHDAEDVLQVEILRFETSQVMEGQLNGRELEESFSFADTESGEVIESSGDAADETYGDYEAVEDDSGTIAMQIPTAWTDRNGSAWLRDDVEVGWAISASTDLEAFTEGYTTPGVIFGASESLAEQYDTEGLLDLMADDTGTGQCDFDGRETYEDPYYTGHFETYKACGDTDAGIIVVAAAPEDESVLLFVLVQVVTDADLEALDKIMDTFQMVGDVEE